MTPNSGKCASMSNVYQVRYAFTSDLPQIRPGFVVGSHWFGMPMQGRATPCWECKEPRRDPLLRLQGVARFRPNQRVLSLFFAKKR